MLGGSTGQAYGSVEVGDAPRLGARGRVRPRHSTYHPPVGLFTFLRDASQSYVPFVLLDIGTCSDKVHAIWVHLTFIDRGHESVTSDRHGEAPYRLYNADVGLTTSMESPRKRSSRVLCIAYRHASSGTGPFANTVENVRCP